MSLLPVVLFNSSVVGHHMNTSKPTMIWNFDYLHCFHLSFQIVTAHTCISAIIIKD